MVLRVASVGLLRLLLTLRPAVGLAAAAAWQGPSDALALVQRALLQQAVLQEPPAQQPPKESSQQLEQSFPPGSEAEVAVAAGSGGVEFQRCTIVGHGAAPNSHDIYLLDVAPAYRSVASVPWELLRSPGGAGRPAAELQVLFGGGAPDDRREVVDKAVALLSRSAKAPADPAKAAELEAALRHEAAKTEALKARLELEQAEASKRKRPRRTPAAKAAKPRRGKASASFDAFDRNGDGIVTREEFQAGEPAKQAANSTPSVPSPTPMPARQRAKVDAGQSVKVWERRAKDWEGECSEEERPRLLQVLETVRFQKAEAVLARLPATCSGQQLGGGGRAVAYEELTTCLQALTNTSWACSVCPVKFMISLGANCQRRCTSLAQGRGRGNDCLECVRQPALRLLRCAGAPGVGEIERRLIGIRLSERTAELFRGGLAQSVGGQQALNRLQRQAWAVQRLIVAWGLDPKGLDMLAAPLLQAIGVKTEAELDATPVPPALPSDDSTSALITASDVARYDADGSGSLDGEELSRAIAGVAEGKGGVEGNKAEGKGGMEGSKGSERSAAEGVGNSGNTTAVPVESSREARMRAARAAEERRLKIQEERKRQAEEHEKWKEEKRKADEVARQKAAEDAKRRAEEMAKQKADQLAERQAREEAARRAKEEEKRKAEEDARLEREEEEERRRNFEARQKADEDARIKAMEDARRQEEEEERQAAEAERQRIENDPRLRAQEAAWKDALEEEGQGETPAEEDTKKKAEEQAKSRAAEEAARQKAAEEARRTEEAAKQKAEEEAKSRAAEEAARQKAAEEARRTEEAAKQKAEEAAQRKAAEEAKMAAAEAANQKVAEEAKRAEEAAKLKAEEAAQRKAAEEAKMAAAEAAKQKVAEEAKRAEEAAKLKAEQEAKTRTEEAMKLKAEEKAVTRTKETAKQEAEKEAKRKAVEPKQQAEEQAKVADDGSRRMAEQEAKKKTESEVKQKAEVTSSQVVATTGTRSTDEAAESTAGSPEEAGADDLS